jgi:hypothetical protein
VAMPTPWVLSPSWPSNGAHLRDQDGRRPVSSKDVLMYLRSVVSSGLLFRLHRCALGRRKLEGRPENAAARPVLGLHRRDDNRRVGLGQDERECLCPAERLGRASGFKAHAGISQVGTYRMRALSFRDPSSNSLPSERPSARPHRGDDDSWPSARRHRPVFRAKWGHLRVCGTAPRLCSIQLPIPRCYG